MKLARSSGAVSRMERADRLRRDRAAALALRAMFPALQQLRLELRFEGMTANTPASQLHVMHPPARAYFAFPCPYADCSGQFDLTGAVNAAVQDPSRQAEGALECCGVRNRDYASKQPCQLRLLYTITATYQREL